MKIDSEEEAIFIAERKEWGVRSVSKQRKGKRGCVKTKPAYPIVSCRGRVYLPEDTKQTVFGRANLAPTN